jgi:SpoIID/LytB domain protein
VGSAPLAVVTGSRGGRRAAALLLAALLVAASSLPSAAADGTDPVGTGTVSWTADEPGAGTPSTEPTGDRPAGDPGTGTEPSTTEDAPAPVDEATDEPGSDDPIAGVLPGTGPSVDADADPEAPAEPGSDGPATDEPATDETVTTAGVLSRALAVRSQVRSTSTALPPIRFRGGGWGHGVGMSQHGAYAMAQAGRSVDDILGHYYAGTTLVDDDRTSSRRIRVGLQVGAGSTLITALDGDVPWRACAPTSGGTNGRLLHADCIDWFVQARGTTVRACPVGGGLRVVADEAGGCASARVLHQTTRPVARLRHHGTTIRTDGRRYTHGWQDLRSRRLNVGSDKFQDVLDVVQDVDTIERYLEGLAEMPSSWGRLGPAALDAQAITGRTYALRFALSPKGGACACDLLATPADQVYTGREKRLAADGELWAAAVARTQHRVLTHGGALALTYYSSSHGGGRSEAIEDSWAYGTIAVPYLRSVADPWSADPRAGNPRASWSASVGNGAFASFVSTGRSTPVVRVERVRVLDRTAGTTPITVEVTGRTAAGQRTTFPFAGRPGDPKAIAGASFRRYLRIEQGGTGGRLNSSQLVSIGFEPFTDDDGSIHEVAISWAARAGIVQGVSASRFAPGAPVTRGQMATFLYNTFEIPATATRGQFSDVATGDTHAAAIAAIAELGLAAGFDDGTFRPGEPVSRQQMATFLARALALSSSATGTFVDVRTANVHRPAIEALVAAGITDGCGAGRFCPADPVARGQLATFLHRAVVG